MSRLGLLEGNRRIRMGNPVIDPASYTGQAVMRALLTTDWPRLFSADRLSARAQYQTANQGSLSPEDYPTLEAFMTAHNMPFQPDSAPHHGPGMRDYSKSVPTPLPIIHPDYNPVPTLDYATLPRDPVSGPAFQPDPAPVSDTPASNAPVTVAPTSPDSAASPKKSALMPLLAALAAYLVVKA